MSEPAVVVFVHGWSVTSLDTYGGLPERLEAEAGAHRLNIELKHIFLSRYISFHDEVRVCDIADAARAAIAEQLADHIRAGRRFICITHSTGGPVMRTWMHKYYGRNSVEQCPMSHLIMLAPANYGSALAQLGKGRLGRLKSLLVDRVEPGKGVLDWLELGSREAWELNKDWICDDRKRNDDVYRFVLTGERIDRKLYDTLNTYTGENGSDGVVRVAAANLQATYLKLTQQQPEHAASGRISAGELHIDELKESPRTALRIISGASHSGKDMGIMRSVGLTPGDEKGRELVDAIFECIKVSSAAGYRRLCDKFQQETERIQQDELIETLPRFLRRDIFIHDRCSMLIFRVNDHTGHPVTDFNLLFTAGSRNSPDALPPGFFVDRQKNSISSESITYFINYDIMRGCPALKDESGEIIRKKQSGCLSLGMSIEARPDKGFVHYLPCRIQASREMIDTVLKPNSTTMIEICLRRIIHRNTFSLTTRGASPQPCFRKSKPSEEIIVP